MRTGELRSLGLQGQPLLGEVVIDAHMHIDTYYNFYVPRSANEDLFAGARRLGISRLYGSSLLAIRGDAQAGNGSALRTHQERPDLFSPYFVVKPNYPEEVATVIARAEAYGIRSFKIHDDGNDLPYDHPAYDPLYEHAEGVGGVILVHTYGRKHVVPMMNVAARFPQLVILLAHSGILDEEIYYDAVRQHPRIYLETCNSLAWHGLIERLVDHAGADRVLFGSDMPFMSPDQQIGRVLFARIPDEVKRRILGLNARMLFGL